LRDGHRYVSNVGYNITAGDFPIAGFLTIFESKSSSLSSSDHVSACSTNSFTATDFARLKE
jgi:hypothetical protein